MRIDVSQSGPIIRVALNRPDLRNAFDDRLIAELTEWAGTVDGTAGEVAVLSGRGSAAR